MADEQQSTPQLGLDDRCHFRVNGSEFEIFKRKSERAGRDYQVLLREMMSAYNDGRLKIKLTETQQTATQELYDND